jgi:ABC-type Fe3+/spermidine/putrescine transport system ATPase subunit
MSTQPAIRLTGLTKSFGSVNAVSGVNLDIAPGEFFSMLGPSGSGKTTVLRMIAGFETPTSGTVELFGKDVTKDAPFDRDVNTVFQDYALFPHLSVAENIAFGLTQGRRLRPGQLPQEALEMIELVGLAGQADRYPHELSGGQQQRVALARALASKPSLVLLDEPFSNLDIALRERLAREVRDILEKTQTTAILVTHDQHEAFAVADEVGVLFDGRLAQWGDPYLLYHEPNSAHVARFVGEGALISGQQLGHHVTTPLGELALKDCCCLANSPSKDVRVLLRPDDVVDVFQLMVNSIKSHAEVTAKFGWAETQ